MTQSSWLSLLDVVFKQAFKTDPGRVEYDLCPRGSFGTYCARDIKECGMKREGGKEWKKVYGGRLVTCFLLLRSLLLEHE